MCLVNKERAVEAMNDITASLSNRGERIERRLGKLQDRKQPGIYEDKVAAVRAKLVALRG